MEKNDYSVDDRGNVAQFYYMESGDMAATLNREDGDNANECTWDGDEAVTAWAEKNGYPDIRTIRRIQ